MPENTRAGLALCSSSGGKDSLLAMWHARANGTRLATLLTMLEENGERTRSHGVPVALMRRQAHALGLDLVAPSASWAGYERVFTSDNSAPRTASLSALVALGVDAESPSRRRSARTGSPSESYAAMAPATSWLRSRARASTAATRSRAAAVRRAA